MSIKAENDITLVRVDDGEKGDKGDKGDAGATGPRGPQGEQGIQGPKGDTGPQGIQGEKGDTGERGATGPQGAQGPQGATGQAGADGADGKSAFEYAQDSGYSGTEAQFSDDLADVPNKANITDLEEVQTSAEQKVAIGDSNIEDITDVMQFNDGTVKVGNDANATEITETGIIIRNETYEVFVSADELKSANSRLSTIKLRNAQNNSGNLTWVAESDGSVSLKVVSD